MSLTADQIKYYEDNGYISPIDILSKDEANEIREEIEFIEKKWPNELEGLGRNYVHLISPVFDKICYTSYTFFRRIPFHKCVLTYICF